VTGLTHSWWILLQLLSSYKQRNSFNDFNADLNLVRKENSIVTHLFRYFFILQPVSPTREFPGPVHIVKDWTEMTKNVTYGLLKNIGNKSFWKTTFRYCMSNCVFICCVRYFGNPYLCKCQQGLDYKIIRLLNDFSAAEIM
jgi:hypothetical protein